MKILVAILAMLTLLPASPAWAYYDWPGMPSVIGFSRYNNVKVIRLEPPSGQKPQWISQAGTCHSHSIASAQILEEKDGNHIVYSAKITGIRSGQCDMFFGAQGSDEARIIISAQ